MSQAERDHQALEVIAMILNGNEWSADTTDAIADSVRTTGRQVRDIE